MFCVECGADGPTYQGLCAKCFPKKHAVVEPPEVLDIERCTSCGSFRFKSGWAKMDRDFALSRLLKDAIPVRPPYQRVSFTQVPREEDANNLSLTVKALGRFEDLETVRDFRIRVRIKPSLCETCQKQRGRYYEGILQVRGDGRDLTPKEIRTARTLVTARIERSGEADTFGGSVGSSPKLFGQQEGREVYRVTSLVRLPAFLIGDVVRHRDGLAEVTALKPFTVLHNLATGESRRFKP